MKKLIVKLLSFLLHNRFCPTKEIWIASINGKPVYALVDEDGEKFLKDTLNLWPRGYSSFEHMNCSAPNISFPGQGGISGQNGISGKS